MKVEPVNSSIKFPELEEDVLKFWQKDDTFKKSLQKNEGKKSYVFYDGPPFATGLPHYGHILTSYIKDTVPRYFTMTGHHVDRRWGWDCHGLPVEFEVEKNLEISGKKEIEDLGVGKFNAECESIVLNYATEWERIINRIGRWVDFDRQYKTMDPDYMESVMWVFHQLYEKGLIYESPKVVPYCIRCQTPLSNFETGLDDSYREKDDQAITVRMKRDGAENESFLIWTTTPWTLPSNVAIGVNPAMEYVKVKREDGELLWLAKERLEAYKKPLGNYDIIETVTGDALVGEGYAPVLPYFANHKEHGAFRLITADFVTAESGTGFVHLAPAFGEDDSHVCQAEGIHGVDPLNSDGTFNYHISDFSGMEVFEANRHIIRKLKEEGSLLHQDSYRHNYPHCWRCDTPLIYRGISSWYVKVTDFKEKLVKNNKQINWVPQHIRDGRFGQWLEGARDWAISRNRFWGSPIPVWRCDDCDTLFVPSSIQNLAEVSGQEVKDLHRPACDEITWQCSEEGCTGKFVRVPEVLDCWFESGAMPVAQIHYPFENEEWFKDNFPADFIVEYISQTRGWFYTLVVLSSALFDKPPFLNSICHGVILAEDGRKMSKRLKNYPDPQFILDTYGSDALRISLLSSAVVRGQDIRFSEKQVRESLRRYLLPLWNVFHFYTAYAALLKGYEPQELDRAEQLDDRHIFSVLEEHRDEITEAMEKYDLPAAYHSILAFVETLSGWYVRNNRHRFWGSEAESGTTEAFNVLYSVLVRFCEIAAPFIPFTADYMYKHLTGSSAHMADWPQPAPERKDEDLNREIAAVRQIIEGVRAVREKNNVNLRQPLRSIKVAGVAKELLERHEALLKGQTNVKELISVQDPGEFATAKMVLDTKKLGPRLKSGVKDAVKAAREGNFEIKDDGTAVVAGHEIESELYDMQWEAGSGKEAAWSQGGTVVSVYLELDDELITEGAARELNRLVQDLRKTEDYAYEQRIILSIGADGFWQKAMEDYGDWIKKEALIVEVREAPAEPMKELSDDRGALKIAVAPA